MQASVEWMGGMAFQGEGMNGGTMRFDSHPDFGGQGSGASPMEALLMAAAACSAMDVLSILEKKKQAVTSYTIRVEAERGPEGAFPRPFTKIRISHEVAGPNLDEVAVARAVELSDTKYCSVVASLRSGTEVVSDYSVNAP